MKYLITESQKENTLKKFIMSNFDRVEDVWFEKRNVYYGSGPVNGKDKGVETIIVVLVGLRAQNPYNQVKSEKFLVSEG